MKMTFVVGLQNKVYIDRSNNFSSPEAAPYSAVNAYKRKLANTQERNLKIIKMCSHIEKTILIVDFVAHQERLAASLEQLKIKNFIVNSKTRKNIPDYVKDFEVLLFTKAMWSQYASQYNIVCDKIINTVYAHNSSGLIGTALKSGAKEFIQVVDNIPMKNVVKRLVGKLHHNTRVEVDKEGLNNILNNFNGNSNYRDLTHGRNSQNK